MVVGYSSDIGPHPERLDLVYNKLFRSPTDLAALIKEIGEEKVREQRLLYDQARATFEELPRDLQWCFFSSLDYRLAWTKPWKGYDVGRFGLVTRDDDSVVIGTLQINPPMEHAYAGLEVVVVREGVKELAKYKNMFNKRALPESQVLSRLVKSIGDVLVYGNCRIDDLSGAERRLKAA